MRRGSSSGVPAQGKADEEEAAAVRAVPLRREVVRVPLRRAASLMVVGASKLRDLIADTETSRAMLASVIDLLDEASGVEGVFLGTLPGPIDAARRTVGRLCGVLPPAAYLQIDQCRVHLVHLGPVFTGANTHFTRCADILRFTDESPQWQRWRRLVELGADQSKEAGERLFKADERAARARLILLDDLVRYWHGLLSLSRATKLMLAEDGLRAAMKLMDEALAAMRQMLEIVTRQANEMIMTLAQNEASASSASSVAGHRRSTRTRGRGTRHDCNCM